MNRKENIPKLTERQKRFCEFYIVELNATKAAIEAGYSKRTARSQGQRLLTKVDVQKKIQELQEEARKKTEVTRDEILKTLTSIIRADLPGYFSEKQFKDFEELTPGQAKAMESVNIKKGSFSFKLTSKLEAIKILNRMLGWEGVQQLDIDVKNLSEPVLNNLLEKLLEKGNDNN